MKIRSVVLSFILAIIPVVGQAQTGGYVGIGVGKALIPSADDGASADGTITLAGTETSLFAGNIYGGLWFSEYFGIEIGYMRSQKGDIKINHVDTTLDYEVDSLYATGIARLSEDASIFKPFVKAGFHKYDITVSVPTTTGGEISTSNDGTKFMLGAGADIAIAESWNIRAEYVYLPYDGGKVHGFFIGVNWAF